MNTRNAYLAQELKNDPTKSKDVLNSKDITQAQVLVTGADISGLEAVRFLIQDGAQTLGVEARNRTGDLFIEYGFVLSFNPYNQLNIEYEIEQLLSNEQIQLIKSFNYFNSLELYSGDNDISWTIIKIIELSYNQYNWSPYDDPPYKHNYLLNQKIKQFLIIIKQNIENDFQQWTTNHFNLEKNILYNDFLTIINDTYNRI
ncbi:unnamed protein product [Rotaria sp. Silwood2]|nr:unnamed protein product [Rotaria sp. Silwood2]